MNWRRWENAIEVNFNPQALPGATFAQEFALRDQLSAEFRENARDAADRHL